MGSQGDEPAGQSYELNDASTFGDIDLEQQQNLVESEEDSDSVSSQTSHLFDDLHSLSRNDPEDFNSNDSFIQRYYQIVGSPKRTRLYFLFGLVMFILLIASWVYVLLSGFTYPESSRKSSNNANATSSILPSPSVESTEITPSTSLESLITSSTAKEPKTLIQIKEYDIHKSRDDVPVKSFSQEIITTTIQFIQTHGLPKEDDEGYYIEEASSNFVVKKLSDNTYEQILQKTGKFNFQNQEHTISTFVPNYDFTLALVLTEHEQLFRHSGKAYYWLFDIEKNSYTPILADDAESKLQHASWSPNFKYITYIQDNNIYNFDVATRKFKQLTTDGSADIFNGRPDWVYEEEVLGQDRSFWWSPDEQNLVYLKIDDTKVKSLDLEFFITDDTYPHVHKIKYPKPGDDNPIVSIHQYNVATEKTTTVDRSNSELGVDFVAYGVEWLDETNLVIKETDRQSKILNYRTYNSDTLTSKVIYSINTAEEFDGWADNWGRMLVITKNETSGRTSGGFVDVLSNEGYNHLIYFATPDTTEPIFLTHGDWEVTEGALAFDSADNLVYFAGNRRSSFEQHVYSVSLETKELNAIQTLDELGFYTADFSPSARFIVLEKEGPSFPLLYKEDTLNKRFMDFTGARRSYHSIEIGIDEQGDPITVNLIEMRPDNFKEDGNYPLLVNVYGGPGSQKTDVRFHITFEDNVVDELNAVVLYVDPRGTGGQGWKYRSWSRKHIGKYEGHDITKAVKRWIDSRNYIDEEKTAIWGWSYGGFSTLKTLEFDKGRVFKFGMAVAPVTDWRLYDSIYTERYMGIPQTNKNGYDEARINGIDGFKDVKRFLIMHGTGDDNVHIQNTLKLLDKFDLHGVQNYDLRLFPDSNHNIIYHNAYGMVINKLTNWITNAYGGHFDSF